MLDLSKALFIPPSTATGRVDKLVDQGYVIREPNKTDRRIVIIKLTQKGLEVYALLQEHKQQILDFILYGLNLEERKTFLSLLLKVSKNIGKHLNS